MSRLRLRESNIGTDSFTPISQSLASSICLRETSVWVGTVTTNREGGSINGSSSLNFRHVSVFLSPAGLCSDVSPEPGGFHSSCSAKRQQGAARYWVCWTSRTRSGRTRPAPAPHLLPVVPARSSPFPHFSWNSWCSN